MRFSIIIVNIIDIAAVLVLVLVLVLALNLRLVCILISVSVSVSVLVSVLFYSFASVCFALARFVQRVDFLMICNEKLFCMYLILWRKWFSGL